MYIIYKILDLLKLSLLGCLYFKINVRFMFLNLFKFRLTSGLGSSWYIPFN